MKKLLQCTQTVLMYFYHIFLAKAFFREKEKDSSKLLKVPSFLVKQLLV